MKHQVQSALSVATESNLERPKRNTPAEGKRASPSEPTPAVRQWVTYKVAFSVSVAVGLAPLLGTQAVPLFSPLLNVIPDIFRDSLIPVTSALMGLVAILVQWFSEEDLDRDMRRRALKWCVLTSFLGVLAFYILSIFVVKPIEVQTPNGVERGIFLKQDNFDLSTLRS